MKSSIPLPANKKIALVAHYSMKSDLLEWVKYNRDILSDHKLFATGTTGKLLIDETSLPIERFQSGPFGGDQQIGARIAEGKIDFLIFFWDPLEPQPHDPDVKALLRLAVLFNIPTASNRTTADFLITSPFMSKEYARLIPDYSERLKRAYTRL